MAKKPLTPEEKEALKAVEAEQEAQKYEAETQLSKKIKNLFMEFGSVDKLYHDGKDVFFTQKTPEMIAVRRSDFITTDKKK
jgi:hypothetical protein